jgi:hypothetical protein
MKTVLIGCLASFVSSALGALIYGLFFRDWELWASVLIIAFPVSLVIGISLSGFTAYLTRRLGFFEMLFAGIGIGVICGLILFFVPYIFSPPFKDFNDLFKVITYWVLVGATFGGLYSASFFLASKAGESRIAGR